MRAMDTVVGRRTVPVAPAAWEERVRAAEHIVVDVGTGDGRAALRLARSHPSWLIVGLDPAGDRMADASGRAARRVERGGAPNAVFVAAAIEAAPPALAAVADEVRVQLPWSGLLRGVVRGDPPVLEGLRRIARDGSPLTAVIGTDIWRSPVPRDVEGLEPLLPGAEDGPLGDRYRACGFEIDSLEATDEEGAAAAYGEGSTGSSWGHRLGAAHGRAGFVVLRARAV